jgi:hypothetical protein
LRERLLSPLSAPSIRCRIVREEYDVRHDEGSRRWSRLTSVRPASGRAAVIDDMWAGYFMSRRSFLVALSAFTSSSADSVRRRLSAPPQSRHTETSNLRQSCDITSRTIRAEPHLKQTGLSGWRRSSSINTSPSLLQIDGRQQNTWVAMSGRERRTLRGEKNDQADLTGPGVCCV